MNALVSFRLERDRPIRVRWLALDGAPGDGYKAQVTAIVTERGRLAMDASAIVERTEADGEGFAISFHGLVGYPDGHPDRTLVDELPDGEVGYELAFVRHDGSAASEGADYELVEAPQARAERVGARP